MIAKRLQKISTPVILALALACLTVSSVTAQSRQNATAPSAGSSQAAGTPPSGTDVIKVVHVKYANVFGLVHLLNFFNVPMRDDSTLKVITLEGPPARVAAVEEAIRQLDVPAPPPQDIVITGYLLMAARQATTAIVPGESWALPEVAGSVVPPQLDAVIEQLKRVLNYKAFIVVDALTLRTVNGGHASVSGLIPIGRTYGFHSQDRSKVTLGDNVDARIDFGVGGPDGASIVRREGTSSISLRGLQLSVMPLTYPHKAPATISTDIDVGQNQQVVVGKTDVLSPNLALFLVISAKITD
jgi:hypothetical protein